jgi:NADH-quinone oxidoreductase subunit C
MPTALDAAKAVRDRFGEKIGAPVVFADKVTGRDEVTITVPRENIAVVCAFLKGDAGCAFDYLVDICAVDNDDASPRFELDYLLYSMKNGTLLRLKVGVPESDPTVTSVSVVWRAANWHEREAYDMMGIGFVGHPDLRRILMWEGYPFHPLRKDFPLEGKPSDVPGVAFTQAAPLEGGPFVAAPAHHAADREPRSRTHALPDDARDKSGKT